MELVLVLAVVMIVFGVGRLPDVFGSVGKGIREFKKNVSDDETTAAPTAPASNSEQTKA
jgi:sec-independent protein translocase protein TatA